MGQLSFDLRVRGASTFGFTILMNATMLTILMIMSNNLFHGGAETSLTGLVFFGIFLLLLAGTLGSMLPVMTSIVAMKRCAMAGAGAMALYLLFELITVFDDLAVLPGLLHAPGVPGGLAAAAYVGMAFGLIWSFLTGGFYLYEMWMVYSSAGAADRPLTGSASTYGVYGALKEEGSDGAPAAVSSGGQASAHDHYTRLVVREWSRYNIFGFFVALRIFSVFGTFGLPADEIAERASHMCEWFSFFALIAYSLAVFRPAGNCICPCRRAYDDNDQVAVPSRRLVLLVSALLLVDLLTQVSLVITIRANWPTDMAGRVVAAGFPSRIASTLLPVVINLFSLQTAVRLVPLLAIDGSSENLL